MVKNPQRAGISQNLKLGFRRLFGKTTGDITFNGVLFVILTLFSFTMLYPFLHIVISSVQTVIPAGTGTVQYTYNLSAYRYVLFKVNGFSASFVWSIFVALATAVCHVFCCMLTAYPLSRKNLKGRKFFLLYMVFTMMFGGGLIPYYLLIRDLGLFNNPLIYILPALVSGYDVIIARNFLAGIPDSLAESAQIDGASHYQTFFRIYLPLSKPIMATLGLWMFVGRWNDWMTGLLYMPKRPDLAMLQTFLRRVLNLATAQSSGSGNAVDSTLINLSGSIRTAIIVVGMLPIVLMYPFVQKYFVKGVLIGSIKG